jgi:hypothetical protein
MSGGIETEGTHQLLMCSDGLNLLGDNLNAARRNIKVFNPIKEISWVYRMRSRSSCLVARMQEEAQMKDTYPVNRWKRATLTRLRTTVVNQSYIPIVGKNWEIKAGKCLVHVGPASPTVSHTFPLFSIGHFLIVTHFGIFFF